jgi:two-component system sensor histidine kinase KdpD
MIKTGQKIRFPGLNAGLSEYIVVVVVISFTALLCRSLSDEQGYHIVSFILFFVVSLMAVFFGIGPILLASTLGALVWNFFFIPPHFAFHIERTEDRLMFGSFFIIAFINGVLTIRIRQQEMLAREREERTNALFNLTRELSEANSLNEIFDIVYRDVKKYFEASSISFLRTEGNKIEVSYNRGNEQNLSPLDVNVAEWVLMNSEKAGRFTEFYTDTNYTFYPLTGRRISPGAIAIEFEKPVTGEKEIFWAGYLTQISNVLERELLNDLALRARLLDESDKLYKTLFTLISHEFRIPIAAIMGASDTLLIPETTNQDRDDLHNEIFKASARLNHLVENLLNMSRLESGKIALRPDWCEINDIFNKVAGVLKTELELHHLESSVPYDMPLVRLDFGLMEQVILNLILNSCQYTPPGTIIRFEAFYREGSVVITVEDNGPGLPSEMINKVFKKFSRADNSMPGGLGLGLSIVKGLVEAHKGEIKVENKNPGVIFTITIQTEIPDMEQFRDNNE